MFNSRSLWNNDRIQFARLLSEIESNPSTHINLDKLGESMDLNKDRVIELFERAENYFRKIKESI